MIENQLNVPRLRSEQEPCRQHVLYSYEARCRNQSEYILKSHNLLNINYPDKFWFLVRIKHDIKKKVRKIGNTSWILRALSLRLFRWFQIDVFAPGQINDFLVTARDVGEPLLVTLKKDGGSFDPDWFVDRVKIKKLGRRPDIIYDFPCNRWVQNESVTIFEGKGKPRWF